MCLLLAILVIILYKVKKAEKKQRLIAQDLIKSIENNTLKDDKELISEPEIISKEIIEPIVKAVPDNIVQNILGGLEKFEARESYLKKGITFNSLAKNIKTNTTYLSDVINSYKGKNFSTYLNDLRIDYALMKLVKDRNFRSYKLSVIAEEVGYNSEQAFSLAFKRKTGTTLSTYIKEI